MKACLNIYNLFYSILLVSLFGCAKNKIAVIADSNATIIQVRFACGPACDAMCYIIKTSLNELYTPISLREEFRSANLSVKIQFKRTGKFPQPFTAPNHELIEIEKIEK